MIPALKRLAVLVLLAIALPVGGGLVQRYGCIGGISESDVLAAAKNAYLSRLSRGKRNDAVGISQVKCGEPQMVDDVIYGIDIGYEWAAFCAHVRDGVVLDSEEFRINRCADTRLWTYVDEGFPKPVSENGYTLLK